MKIDWVLGFLPVFIRETPLVGYRGLTRLIYIKVNSFEDKVCVEHEKVHAKDAYIFIIMPVLIINLLAFSGLK